MALIQHWALNDNAASTTVVATVGNNGTLAGGDNTSVKYTVDGPGGSITACFDLNGTDDAVTITGAALNFASGAAWSVSAWCNFDATTGTIIGLSSQASTHRIIKSTDAQILVRGSSGGITFTTPSLGTTNWHHILVTHDTSNNVRVFIDGTESSSGTQALAGTFGPDSLARTSTAFYDGRLAWVKVFDSDEAANVGTLYAEGTSGGATAYTFTGPTSGVVNVASTNFTITPNGTFTGTITPATDGAGSFTPTSLTWAAEAGAKTCTYTPTSTTGSPHTLSTSDNGGLTDPATIDYTVTTGSIAVSTPTQYRTFQRTTNGSLAGTPGGTTGAITITGTYTGSPTAIEASFNGGAYSTIVASPSGGSYSGSLTSQAQGQGTLTVRFTNDTSISSTVADVGIGDVVLIVGQSNAEGRLAAGQSYSHATLKGTMYAHGASAWANLADPTDAGTSSGSFWPLLATEWMADQGVPVAFITAADGGTALVGGPWLPPSGANYTGALARVTAAGVNSVRLVIKYQGESDSLVAVTRAAYLSALTSEADAYAANVAGAPKTVVFMFGQSSGMDEEVPLAISEGWDAGGNIIGGPLVYDHSNSLHPSSSGNPSATGQLIARRIWAAVDDGIFDGANGRGPQLVSVSYDATRTALTVRFNQTLKTGLTHTTTGFVVTGNAIAATISAITYSGTATEVVLHLSAPAALPILVSMGLGTSSAGKTYPQSVDVTTPSAATINLPAEPFETETASAASSGGGVAGLINGGLISAGGN